MRCCGNCCWSFSSYDEDELRSEYHGDDYDLDPNTPKAGDCCIGRVHNNDYYCPSHVYDELSSEYKDYLSLIINECVSIDLYNLIKSSWSHETNGVDEDDMVLLKKSTEQDDVTSLLIRDLLGGKIMKCLSVKGDHYYNEINGAIIDLTSDQFELGEEPLYCDSVEESPILDEDLMIRYRKLLSNFRDNLCDYSFEKITGDERILRHKEFLDTLCTFSTFEIDEYYQEDGVEYVQFDLSAQNTGNIFRYKHDLNTDEYFKECQMMYTSKGVITELPIEIVKSVFDIAKDNVENIKLLKKLKHINSHK